MWLVAEYRPVGLFSLKNALATSSGAKSLLVPTPYALKMALLDAACRLWGEPRARLRWPMLRDLAVALRPAERAVVTNLFAKVLKPRRNPALPGTPDAGPLGKTIAFREYVWIAGTWAIALRPSREEELSDLLALLPQINYLGKRGGFVQLLGVPARLADLPDNYVLLNPAQVQPGFQVQGLMQMLDDCGPKMTYDQANVYSDSHVTLGKDRILRHVVLPYRLARSSKSYSLYERIDD